MPIFDLTLPQRDIGQSLVTALRMLGLRAVLGCPGQYIRDFMNKLKTNNMQFDLLKDFDALCSSVGHSYYWLDKQYPDAKFIFIDQDPAAWAKAVIAANDQLKNLTDPATAPNSDPKLDLFTYARLLSIRCIVTDNQDYLVYLYNMQKMILLDYFKDRIDGKLLIMKPADGWEPLCAFLGRNVPTTPFPIVAPAA